MFTYQVVYLNRAPVVFTHNRSLTSILEDTPSLLGDNVGNIAMLFAEDDDDSSLGIAVTQFDSSNGQWQYRTNASEWVNFPCNISYMAFHLLPSTWIRFNPNQNFVGTISITAIAWDVSNDNSITLSSFPTFSPTGPYSQNSSQLLLDVFPVNDPPFINLTQSEVNFTENGVPIPIFGPSLTIVDPDNSQLQQATVVLTCTECPREIQSGTSFFLGSGQSLTPSLSDMIIAKYPRNMFQANLTETETGFNLSITALVSNATASFEAYLRSLCFTTVMDEPSLANRNVSLVVFDGQMYSNNIDVTVQVIPVNDNPPEVFLPYLSINYTEQSGELPLFPASTVISDPDEPLPLYNLTSMLTNAKSTESIFSNYSGAIISVNSTKHTVSFSNAASIDEYNTALSTLFYSNKADEPGKTICNLRIMVCDNTYCTQSDLAIQVNPINDNLPVVTVLNKELSFMEANPDSPPVAVADMVTITDKDVPFTPIESVVVEIFNPMNLEEERLYVIGTPSPHVSITSSSTLSHRLVIRAAPMPLQLSILADTLRMVYYENTAEQPSGLHRTIRIFAYDNLSQPGEQNFSNETINLLFHLIDDPPSVMLNNLLVMYKENSVMRKVLLAPNATITDVDNNNLSALKVELTASFSNLSHELLTVNTSILTDTSITLNPLAPASFNLTGVAPLSTYQLILRSLAYENTDTSGNPKSGTREVTVSGYSVGGAGAGTPDKVTIAFMNVNNPPLLDLNGNRENRDYTVIFTEGSSSSISLLAPDFQLQDPDSANLTYVNITLAPNLDGEKERLVIDNTTSSVSVEKYSSFQITLRGQPSPISNFRILLSTLSYLNEAEEPSTQNRLVTFVANDGELSSVVAVTNITVLPVNDPPVVFLSGTGATNYSTQYTENRAAVPLTLNSQVIDSDSNVFTMLRIELVNHKLGDTVTANNISLNFSSEVYIADLGSLNSQNVEEILDSVHFSNVLPEPPAGEREFCFSVFDGSDWSKRACTIVEFIPVNDNPLIYSQDSYSGSILEGKGNASVNLAGLVSLNEGVSDSDTLNSPVVREWSIVAGDDCHNSGGETGDHQFFSGDSSTEQIMVPDMSCRFVISDNGLIMTSTTPPDREMRDFYNLTISVSDGIFTAMTVVQVTILDTKDTPPCFIPNSYNATIPQGAQPGYVLTNLTVVDPDENDTITFFPPVVDPIDAPAGNVLPNTFKISNSGELILTIAETNLPGEIPAYILREIIAIDSVGLETSMRDGCTGTALIQASYNKQAPVFSKSNYLASLPETTPIGSTILTVMATDSDDGTNGEIRYSISQSDLPFVVQSVTGNLLISSTLDFETTSQYHFSVIAEDQAKIGTRMRVEVNVTIVVENVNEFSPTISPLSVTTCENLPVSSLVIQLNATDNDAGIFGELAYSSVSAAGCLDCFTVSRNGSITVVMVPDADNGMDTAVLAVEVADGGGKVSFTDVTINILNDNDAAPQFVESSYSITIPEDYPSDTPFLSVQATDSDTCGVDQCNATMILDNRHPCLDPTQVKYSITNGNEDLFRIDSSSGDLSLVSMLDFDVAEHRQFILAIAASDGQLEVQTQVHVTVLNISEDSPVFENSSYEVTISESTGVSDIILTVVATDADQTPFTYSISGPGADDFTVGRTTGVVSVAQQLDFENRHMYFLMLRASEGNDMLGIATLNITLIDVNDNAPQFEQQQYNFSIAEDEPLSTYIGVVIATDEDSTTNSEIFYSISSITPQTEMTPFVINQNSGAIFSNIVFDREMQAIYSVMVLATDKGDPVQSAYVSVTVAINDKNDNDPSFTQNLYNASVKEDAANGSIIITLTASDADADENARLTYAITDGNEEGKFAVNPVTGDLILVAPLDFEMTQQYQVLVMVSDSGTLSRHASTILNIAVKDANDIPPVFTSDLMATVVENSPSLTQVLKLTASDADTGSNAIINFIIADIGSSPFTLDSVTGTVTVYNSSLLDREMQSLYEFDAVAFNPHDIFSQNATAVVTIVVSDQNDNPPLFSQATFSVEIEESFTPVHKSEPIAGSGALEIGIGSGGTSSVVAQISASDKDDTLTPNGQIKYYVIGGSGQNIFTIDEHSGVIQTTAELDREVQQSYTLTVRATDCGDTPLSSTANVEIAVLDINDNQPAFTQGVYTAEISENSFPGTDVIITVASDADIGSNAQLTYSLATGNTPFTINQLSGTLIVSGSIDRETTSFYHLEVLVFDGGFPILNGSAIVRVTVLDVNDNAPSVEQLLLNSPIQENVSNGTLVASFAINDSDIGSNAVVTLQLSGDAGNVAVTPNGEVRVVAPLDYEQQASFMMNLTAISFGPPSLSTTVSFRLDVININDNPPAVQFNNPSIEFTEGVSQVFLDEAHLRIVDNDGENFTSIYSGVVEFSHSSLEPSHPFIPSTIIARPYECDLENKQSKFRACQFSNRQNILPGDRDISFTPFGGLANPEEQDTLVFDAAQNQFVYAIDATSFSSLDGDALTIMLWVWYTPKATPSTIYAQISDNGYVAYGAVCDTGSLMLLYYANNTQQSLTVSRACDHLANTWHHLAVVIEPRTSPMSWLAVYIDGTLFFATDILQPVDNSGRLYLGARPVSGLNPPAIEFFTGRMHLLIMSPFAASDVNINCVIGCGTFLYSSLSASPVNYSYNYTNRFLLVNGVTNVETYENFLNSLILVVAFEEAKDRSYSLDFSISDGIFFSMPTSLNITIIPNNDGDPVLRLNGEAGANYAVTFLEEGGPTSIVNATSLTLTDIDLLAFNYEVVARITNPLQPAEEEVLAVSNLPTGMTQSYMNYTLRVRGQFVLSEFQSILRTLTYNNLADELVGTFRTVSVVVLDEDSGPRMSEVVLSEITFQVINDPPELNVVSANQEYSEGDGFVQILTSAIITDNDNTTLSSVNVAFPAPDGSNETLSVTVAMGVDISVLYSTSTTENILTLTGVVTIENYAAVLESLMYQNSLQDNPTAGTRVITFILFDGLSFSSPVQTNLFIAGVNDFPVVDLNGQRPGVDFQTSFMEDIDELVAAVSPNLTLIDVDSAELGFINITFSLRPDGDLERVILDTNDTSLRFIENGNTFLLVPVNSSVAPIDDFVNALSTLKYYNDAEEPDLNQRVLQIVVSDGIDTSSSVYSRISIISRNDKPFIDLDSTSNHTGYSTVFIENSSPVAITSPNVVISDNDVGSYVTRIRIRITNPTDGNSEVIQSTDSSVNLSSSVQPEYIIVLNNMSALFAAHILTSLVYINTEAEPTPGIRETEISLSDGTDYSITVVSCVNVVLINEHAPIFLPLPPPSVLENSPPNTDVVMVTAMDQDKGVDGIIKYSIIAAMPATGLDRFMINETSGLILTTTPLDREETVSYSLVIFAEDMGSPSLNATTIFNVTVSDENDNLPRFVPSTIFSLSVSELASIGDIVETIRAVDPDLPSNNVVYSAVGGNGSALFNVLFEGEIVVVDSLDADSVPNPVYTLVVTLTDYGGQTSQAEFTITVQDANDNSPQFNSTLYEAEVNENLVSAFVTQVFATDRDSSSNAKITYSISSSDFTINNVTGEIHTARPLDREMQEIYEFTVTATDSGTSHYSNTSTVRARVIDVNDNQPVFSKSNYAGTIVENTPVGLPVVMVAASDPDAGSNAAVRYKLDNNLLSLFGINSSTGQIIVEEPLDYEVLMPVHTITVIATDTGLLPLSGSATVTITILDVNDNAPEFTNFVYSGSVPENAFNYSVATVSATDVDSGSNGDIHYQLFNHTDRFAVGETNGIITTLVGLDFEETCSYQFTVRAYDLGFPSLSAFAVVNVNVLPLNDRPPRFNRSEYKTQVVENSITGTFVADVHAVDDDEAVCGEEIGSGIGDMEPLSLHMNMVSYSLLNYTDIFEIDNSSGLVTTKTFLDREQITLYTLTVSATDPSGLTSQATVVVMIGDVNDNQPKFLQDQYERHIPENSEIGTTVLHVLANDPDMLDAGRLEYSLNGNDVPDYLSIERQSGIITVNNKIDFEAVVTPVSFLALVHDTNGSFDAADVTIFIVDTNDRPPSISAAIQTVPFTEGQVSINPFINVSISDQDTLQNLTNATITLITSESISNTASSCLCTSSKNAATCSIGCFEFLQLSNTSFPGTISQTGTGHVLTLEGSYPITVYQSAISSIEYVNIISNPLPDSRMVSIVVNDGQLPSNTLINTIQMTLLNQFAPVVDLNGPFVSGIDYKTQFTERGPPVLLTSPNMTIFDEDTSNAVQQLTAVMVWIVNPLNAMESIGFPPKYFLPPEISMQQISSYNISLVGQAPLNTYMTILRQLQYFNPTDEPNATTRQVNFRAEEFHLSSTTSTTTITFNTFNDFPPRIVANPPADNYMTEYREGESGVPLVAPTIIIEDRDGTEDPVVQLQVSIIFPGQFDSIFFRGSNYSSSITITQLSPTRLRITGNVPRTSYEDILRGLRYRYTNDELTQSDLMNRKFVAMEIYDDTMSSVSFTQITLIAVNDQQPVFSQILYTAFVSENATIGYTVIQLQASDGDRFTNSQMQFSITAGNDNSLFTISSNGTITLNSMLNFERVQFHNLTVRVVDPNYVGNDTGGIAMVEIAVGDSNDHVPEFNQTSYNGTVSEGASPGTIVLSVFAEDADSSIHSQLVFEVTGTTLFTIDAAGTIRTSAPIDRETSEFHVFNVTVRNPGFLAHGIAQVFVIVIDTNDNNPEIILFPNKITLTEPQTLTSLATSVDIVDPDPSPSIDRATVEIDGTNTPGMLIVPSNITVSFSGNGTSELEFFGLRTLSVYKTILSSIFYQDLSEEPDLLERIVVYQVFSGATNSTVVRFTINIETINDNPPVLQLDTRNISLSVSPSEPEFAGFSIDTTPGNYLAIFEEGSSAVPLTDSSLTISDDDVGDKVIQSAFIELTNPGDGAEERIIVTLLSGIAGDISSHRLQLQGSGTHEEYMAVLRTIR